MYKFESILNLIFIVIITILLSTSCHEQSKHKGESEDEMFKPSYKEQIKNAKDSVRFEVFFDSTNNLYSNYKYGVSMKFPKGWDIDMGVAEHTIIRGVQKDSAITFAISVMEVNGDLDKEISIWDIFNEKKVREALGKDIINFKFDKLYFDNKRAIRQEYETTVLDMEMEYTMKTITIQAIQGEFTYNIGLTVPGFLYDFDPNKYESLFYQFKFIKTKDEIQKLSY